MMIYTDCPSRVHCIRATGLLRYALLVTMVVLSFAVVLTPSVYGEETDRSFPRTVTVDGRSTLVSSKPMRIAAVSGPVADILLELVDTDRMAVIPMHMDNPVMYRHADKAKYVGAYLPAAVDLDPEAVLAHDPDLIVMTLTHGAETDALDLMTMSGVPTIAMADWSDFDALKNNIVSLGRAVGEDDAAIRLVRQIDERLDGVAERLEGVTRRRVLPLSVVSPDGTTPFLIGPTSFLYDVLTKAGAVSAGDALGVTRSTPIDLEQLIVSNPDDLLLSDWAGTGPAAYEEFLNHPGMQAVEAVATDRVLILPYRHLWHTLDAVDGVETIARWLYPDRF